MVTMQRKFPHNKKRYLVLKVKGLEFIETWFGIPRCIPPNLTKLYQLLLHMVTMKGIVPMYLALKLGYASRIIEEAVTRGYVELSLSPKKPSQPVLRRVKAIIEKPSRGMIV